MLDAGVVVPMNQDNEGRELYTLFPNANSVAFDGVGLTILDLQEEIERRRLANIDAAIEAIECGDCDHDHLTIFRP